jgi:hypothetical protein
VSIDQNFTRRGTVSGMLSPISRSCYHSSASAQLTLADAEVEASISLLIFGALAHIFRRALWYLAVQQEPVHKLQGRYTVKKALSLVVLATVLCAGPVFAADPIVGTWKLNIAKSRFAPGNALTAATRVYTEANGLYTLDIKQSGADSKEASARSQYRDGKEEKQTSDYVDVILAKRINENTWVFDLKKDGKVVGRVHRVVSADGKTLTVHNTGMLMSGVAGDETLVFDKQ